MPEPGVETWMHLLVHGRDSKTGNERKWGVALKASDLDAAKTIILIYLRGEGRYTGIDEVVKYEQRQPSLAAIACHEASFMDFVPEYEESSLGPLEAAASSNLED